ncbi:MAG: J domain-containing protein [Azospirillaceae bacterium]|nr:J domain-containing protein [Azospirillaceae bacterium]
MNDYFWFCLDHVRQYNKDWDYYAGMSEQEIEAQLRQDVTWQRPSWPIGGWRAAEHQMRHRATNDFYGGSAGTGRGEGMGADAGAGRPQGQPRSAEAEALDLLDLPCDADVVQIKARYRELVKLHHPDANGGDRDAEERLKRINQAYTTLKASFGI